MPTPDLPIELWLEILRYLPRSTLRKMIGVNRVLFELALDDLYSEVRIISDDIDAVRMFEHLSFPNISMRVRHLFIRPAFLPVMGEDLTSVSHSHGNNPSKILSSIRNGIKRATSTSCTSVEMEASTDPSAKILKPASRAIRSCTNLHDITLIVHDQVLTPSFVHFLDSLWALESIGTSLRKLVLDTTVVKFPPILNTLTKNAASLPNLDTLAINISISRIQHSGTEWKTACDALVKFFKAFRGGLTSFIFSSLVMNDLNTLFELFPKFPKLTAFEFRSVFNIHTFPHSEDLTRFIHRHSQTLTTLLIKPRGHSATASSSDDSYSVWLHHPPALQTTERLYSLTQLVFPKLKSLDVGLREVWGGPTLVGSDQTPNSGFGFLPDLTRVTPNLTRLVITDVKLIPQCAIALLNMLGTSEGGSSLEELDIAIQVVYPQLFDRLSQTLPHLRALTIECARYSTMDNEIANGFLSVTNCVGFEETMRSRIYLCLDLRYLRIGSMYHCGVPHPNYAVMQSVADSLSHDVELDTELRCDCVENVNFHPPRTLLTAHPAGRSGMWYTPLRLLSQRR